MKAIISGGGTGGHIFPAIAIANALKERHPEVEITFVGANGRMEMEKVPAAGYKIVGLPIAGLQRKLTLKNLALPFKLLASRIKVSKLLRSVQPDVVIGVGGYASAPTLKRAASMGFPTLIQEQNSFPGLTNRLLAQNAKCICVAYEGMEKYFPAEKIVLAGNPVRKEISHSSATKQEGLEYFQLDASIPTVLSVGGSLGAKSINMMILDNMQFFAKNKIQLVWQTGRSMYEQAKQAVEQANLSQYIKVHQFINRMDLAYAAADAIVSRAGAIAISELCIVGKPLMLIPSPNVTEDHQTKNAMALVNKGAAVMVRDVDCHDSGLNQLLNMMNDKEACQSMHEALHDMSTPNAVEKIIDEIDKLLKRTNG